jgi:NitT/TauT family transport system permease protein
MSEGGIGSLLIKYNKYNDLTNVIALQVLIFLMGLCFDFLLGTVRQLVISLQQIKTGNIMTTYYKEQNIIAG